MCQEISTTEKPGRVFSPQTTRPATMQSEVTLVPGKFWAFIFQKHKSLEFLQKSLRTKHGMASPWNVTCHFGKARRETVKTPPLCGLIPRGFPVVIIHITKNRTCVFLAFIQLTTYHVWPLVSSVEALLAPAWFKRLK